MQDTKSKINTEEIRDKLYAKLKPSGWANKLKLFIHSSDFMNILNELVKEAEDGKRFVPQLKYIFDAFVKCPYDDTKIVVIAQDPYPYPNISDGIAFSCSLKNREEKPLQFIFDAIEETVYPETQYHRDPDLTRWSKQGVLLLNSSLTVPIGKAQYHQKLWRPFIAYLLDILNFSNLNLTYIFMGTVATKWKDSISDNNYKIVTEHPAVAVYNKKPRWDSNDCFNKANKFLKKNNVQPINW